MSKLLTIKYDILSDKQCLERTLKGRFTSKSRSIGYHKPDSLGLVVYDNITSLSAEIYLGGVGNWVTRSIINHFLKFAFDTLKVKRIVAHIDPSNEKSIKFAKGLGFVKECTLRGIGVYQYSLLKEDTRYYGIYSRFI